MKNPIPNSSLFVTLESVDALADYIEQMSGPEKALAYTIAMMTFNIAHNMIEELHITEAV